MMELIPMEGYVVIKEAEEIIKGQTKSGIILPTDIDEEVSNQGKIVKLPEEYPGKLAVHDLVIYKRHLFDELDVAGHHYILGEFKNITAIIRPVK